MAKKQDVPAVKAEVAPVVQKPDSAKVDKLTKAVERKMPTRTKTALVDAKSKAKATVSDLSKVATPKKAAVKITVANKIKVADKPASVKAAVDKPTPVKPTGKKPAKLVSNADLFKQMQEATAKLCK